MHYIHIPKTGGSALRSTFERANEVLGHEVVITHGHDFRVADVPPGDTCIICVRDPVTRFVSGFNSRLRKGRPRYDVGWSWRERLVFTRFRTPDALAAALARGSASARWAMHTISHLRHLSQWLGSAADFQAAQDQVLYLARQETLDADWLRIRSLLGLPATLHLPTDPIARHRTPDGMSTRLSERGRAAIEAWYRPDQELLRICDEISAKRT